MKLKINNWIKQASEELETAKVDFNAGKYFAVAFWCQQAVEKALKGMILEKKRDDKKIDSHSLLYLAKEAEVPKNLIPKLKKLSPQYILSRYPDMSEEVPYEIYDKDVVDEFIKIAEEVLAWIKNQLK